MKVCLYTPIDDVYEPIRQAVRESFTDMSNLPHDPTAAREFIVACDLALIDITDPFSSYLLGIADALGKATILLAPSRSIIPKLFEDRRAIIHAWNSDHLKSELQNLTPSSNDSPIDASTPTGRFQKMFGDLLKKHAYRHDSPVEFENGVFTLREQEMEFPLVQEISHRAKSLNVRVRLL